MHGRAVAHGELVRQVLLDGDAAFEGGVVREVGDAETADAEHLDQPVGVELVARRQRLPMLRSVQKMPLLWNPMAIVPNNSPGPGDRAFLKGESPRR